jgi:hypothetical protein
MILNEKLTSANKTLKLVLLNFMLYLTENEFGIVQIYKYFELIK